MRILRDDLNDGRVAELLRQHLEEMRRITPPESVHALDLEALRSPDITFWSAWEGDELVGCGALKELDARTGEIKSMRTVEAHRRRGIASRILEHLIQEAKRRGYQRLHLETAALPEFAPARALYRQHGFRERGPFGDYRDDPNTVFLTRRIR